MECSFLNDAKLKLEKASKQLNLSALSPGLSVRSKHKRERKFFDGFLYKDHVTFKNI